MNKKQQRIRYLVGIHKAINNPRVSLKDSEEEICTYDEELIKRVLKTVEALLEQDGISNCNK